MAENRDIRIFCPVHAAVFEVPGAPSILCEITGHTLSSDFPNAEFWEFCCTCETFSPSALTMGQKARTSCFGCQNEIEKWSICGNCKTVSFVSVNPSRGQVYFINDQGVEPRCPACETGQEDGMVRHDCPSAEAEFFTALESCPFCLRKTVKVSTDQPQVPVALSDYLSHIGKSRPVRYDYREGMLVPDPDRTSGLLLLLDKEALYLVPDFTVFQTRNDYANYLERYFDCAKPMEGTVWIRRPATVKKSGSGWQLASKGDLEVR